MPFGGDNAESYYDEGLTLTMKGDFQAAIARFDKALQLDPSLNAALYQLGRCHLRLGNGEQAVKILTRAVALMPRLVTAKTDLGYSLFLGNQIENARRTFADVLEIKPDQAFAILGLAYCAFHQRQWDTAMNLADRVVGTGAERFESLYLAGRAAHMQKMDQTATGRLHAADKILDQMIEAGPDQPEGYFLRGQILCLCREYNAALEAFRAAEDHAKPDIHYSAYHEHFELIDILAGQGYCLRKLRRDADAQAIARRMLTLKPDSKRAQQILGGSTGEET